MPIVTGAGPHENVIIPPAATAATTASEVQLGGVPSPITRVGPDVSTALASGGTAARPFGLPAEGNEDGLADGDAEDGAGGEDGPTGAPAVPPAGFRPSAED
jgi:hypothetical protein